MIPLPAGNIVVQRKLLQPVIVQQYGDTFVLFVSCRKFDAFGKLVSSGKKDLPFVQHQLSPLIINLGLPRNLIDQDMLWNELLVGIRLIKSAGIEKRLSEYLGDWLQDVIQM